MISVPVLKERRNHPLNHLKTLYPEKRATKKREELDRLATSYIQALYGYLPCLDITTGTHSELAYRILQLVESVAQTQKQIECGNASSLQGGVAEASETPEPATLTPEQHVEMVALIKQHRIFVGQDDDGTVHISHPSRPDRTTAYNEVEIYKIVQEIASELSGAR